MVVSKWHQPEPRGMENGHEVLWLASGLSCRVTVVWVIEQGVMGLHRPFCHNGAGTAPANATKFHRIRTNSCLVSEGFIISNGPALIGKRCSATASSAHAPSFPGARYRLAWGRGTEAPN